MNAVGALLSVYISRDLGVATETITMGRSRTMKANGFHGGYKDGYCISVRFLGSRFPKFIPISLFPINRDL
jgi:hypothetical protein